jgi:glycosyltransferase involved in cell wall biosynthesis
MNIGFDAKRAFLNQSGLGNYSRTLIKSIAHYFPYNYYSLFTTKKKDNDFSTFFSSHKNVSVIQPENFFDKIVPSYWRSYTITEFLITSRTDIYHGLSNELPFTINKFKGKKVLTIHDLIFRRYPQFYNLPDRTIYNEKCMRSCKLADVIIATSQQTKNDIIEFYNVPQEKIRVVYQSCSELFYKETDAAQSKKILLKYNLPANYLLYIGTIEKRKNLLTILKALTLVKDIPLVVIGRKKTYFKEIKKYITENNLESRIIFPENIHTEELPSLYKNAAVFIYPSLFEGFGIPILEALTSQTPVITTKGGCFEEAGGQHSIYINPLDYEQLAEEINKLLASSSLCEYIAAKGLEHSKKFLPVLTASETMKLYCGK